MKNKLSAPSDDEWMARDDANTLARAAEIKADKARMAKAAKAAQKMVDDAQVKARALKRIAKTKPPKKRPSNAGKNKKS
jgi:hypothetical protein